MEGCSASSWILWLKAWLGAFLDVLLLSNQQTKLLLKGGKFFMGHGFRSPGTELEELMRVQRAVGGQQGHDSFTQGLKTRQKRWKASLSWRQSPHRGERRPHCGGSKERRSALESRRVSLGAHWVDSRESSLLRRLERGREIGL